MIVYFSYRSVKSTTCVQNQISKNSGTRYFLLLLNNISLKKILKEIRDVSSLCVIVTFINKSRM